MKTLIRLKRELMELIGWTPPTAGLSEKGDRAIAAARKNFLPRPAEMDVQNPAQVVEAKAETRKTGDD